MAEKFETVDTNTLARSVEYGAGKDISLSVMRNRLIYLSDRMQKGWHYKFNNEHKIVVDVTLQHVSGLHHEMDEEEQQFFEDALEAFKEGRDPKYTITAEKYE